MRQFRGIKCLVSCVYKRSDRPRRLLHNSVTFMEAGEAYQPLWNQLSFIQSEDTSNWSREKSALTSCPQTLLRTVLFILLCWQVRIFKKILYFSKKVNWYVSIAHAGNIANLTFDSCIHSLSISYDSSINFSFNSCIN